MYIMARIGYLLRWNDDDDVCFVFDNQPAKLYFYRGASSLKQYSSQVDMSWYSDTLLWHRFSQPLLLHPKCVCLSEKHSSNKS